MGHAYLVFKCFIYRSMNRFRVEEAATSRRMAYGSLYIKGKLFEDVVIVGIDENSNEHISLRLNNICVCFSARVYFYLGEFYRQFLQNLNSFAPTVFSVFESFFILHLLHLHTLAIFLIEVGFINNEKFLSNKPLAAL